MIIHISPHMGQIAICGFDDLGVMSLGHMGQIAMCGVDDLGVICLNSPHNNGEDFCIISEIQYIIIPIMIKAKVVIYILCLPFVFSYASIPHCFTFAKCFQHINFLYFHRV